MQGLFKYFKGEIKLFREIILGRLGFQNDFVGYESLIETIGKKHLGEKQGDFLEIGAFMGGGSRKLARYARKYGKNLHVIDLFDPNFDLTANDRGETMQQVYRKILGQKNLREVFNKNTKNEKNLFVYDIDSKKIALSKDLKLCFSFIDGNHDPQYVKNDFRLAWEKTVSGGIVAFHDFKGDLPQTTTAIKEILEEQKNSIAQMETLLKKTILFIAKK